MSDEYLGQVVEHLRTCAGHQGTLRAARAMFEPIRRKSKLMRSLMHELRLDWEDTQDALNAVFDIMLSPMAVAREVKRTLLSPADLERMVHLIFAAFIAEDDVQLARWRRESNRVRAAKDDRVAAQRAARSWEQAWLERIAGE